MLLCYFVGWNETFVYWVLGKGEGVASCDRGESLIGAGLLIFIYDSVHLFRPGSVVLPFK